MKDIELLTYDDFSDKVKQIEGRHWSSGLVSKRWDYHARAVNLIKALKLKDPKKILEMGTMGMQCAKESTTIDYTEKWDFPGKNPTYVHDAREFPWPIEDKKFELFIALRVFQHLAPYQEKCLKEAMRISKKVLIIVPAAYSNSNSPEAKGITYKEAVNFLDGIHPNIFAPTEVGDLFYWDTENSSSLNLEDIVQSPFKVTKKEVVLKHKLSGKIKRKIKRIFK